MLIRPIRDDEHELYNQIVDHPLQTWEWGEFRRTTGVEVERIGFFEHGQLQKALQVTFHHLPIPGLKNYTIGYLPRSYQPDEEQLSALKQIAAAHQALFIKLEPNLACKIDELASLKPLANFLIAQGCQPGRPLFTQHTFQLNLANQTEESLFANFKSKTRYNIRLAIRKGVTIVEDSSPQGLQIYLDILAETTHRQKFYAHGTSYFQKMWDTLANGQMMKVFIAYYENQPLVAWVVFKLNGTIYYPYGASRSIHREVMASNLMMWEVIRYGLQSGCTLFDMWGALGPDYNPHHPWAGFHRFKEGYSGDLMRFLGTFDLVTNYPLYKIFRIADDWRWKLLRLKANLSNLNINHQSQFSD